MLQKKYTISLILVTLFMLSGCLETVFVGSAGTMVEFAKDRPAEETVSDVKIATAIKAEFVKKNFRELYTKIKIEVMRGRVLYTGTIDNEQDSIEAVQIAWNQTGVKEVINELKVDKNSSQFDLLQYTKDSMTTSQVKSKIFLTRNIKFINYTVITLNDIVYLFGIAKSEEELEKVALIASNTSSVKKVISHVKIHNMDSVTKAKPESYNSVSPVNISDDLLVDKDSDDINLDQGI